MPYERGELVQKMIRIEYNPYLNMIGFSVSIDSGTTWNDIAETSELLKYQNQECVFSNCVEDIVSYINQYQNSSSEGICIQFVGTDADYAILQSIVEYENKTSTKKGKIITDRIGIYRSADESIEIIRNAYIRIADEFKDYLPDNIDPDADDDSVEIGKIISTFNDTVSKQIPICIIGTYSVGKSAFINAIIGDEILPSKVDPCTAKNVKIESADTYSICFDLSEETVQYEIKDGTILIADDQSESARRFTSVLEKHCIISGKRPAVILHDILVAFNESTETFPEVNNIGWNVCIKLPFSKSILDQKDSKVVFIDTPGSNNSDIDQQQHRLSLEKLMGEQTNALPVFVMDRNQVISNDNNEVKSLIDDNKTGFSNPNCIIVFSKAENIPRSAFNQTIPLPFLNWHGKTTFLYTCAVGAIGCKKEDPTWLDPEYKDCYSDWKIKFDKDNRILPQHNIVPCGRTMDRAIRSQIDDELYATGIPSVEDEINYYVSRYSNYKKCVNGRALLIDALSRAAERLSEKKDELNSTKKKKIKEQKEKRKELIDKLEAVTVNTVNVQYVVDNYKEVLDAYCESVLPEIESIWDEAKESSDIPGFISAHMQDHCMKNLFMPAYEGEDGIQHEIVRILTSCATDYVMKLRKIVEERECDLSEQAQSELNHIFKSIKNPSFREVHIQGNNLLHFFSILLPFLKFFEDKYRESLASDICNQLKHQNKTLFQDEKIGLFAEECIQRPVKEYYAQLKEWQEGHLESIKGTLDKDNSILSQYDSLITDLVKQIESMEARLNNLDDVHQQLETVLDSTSEVTQ